MFRAFVFCGLGMVFWGGSRKMRMKRVDIIGACSRSCVSAVRLTVEVQERGFRGIILGGLRKEVVGGGRVVRSSEERSMTQTVRMILCGVHTAWEVIGYDRCIWELNSWSEVRSRGRREL